jgi:hypothetical protein
MAQIARAALYGKLNSVCYKAMESATVFCKLRGNPYVETVHWLHQLLQTASTDFNCILTHFGVDTAAFAKEITELLDRLPRGSTSISDISPEMDAAVERAWLFASLMFGESAIRSGHILIALLKSGSAATSWLTTFRSMQRVTIDELSDNFVRIVGNSAEHDSAARGNYISPKTSNREIFISYRRAESQHVAGRMFDHLEREFGQDRVFKDVDSIPIGTSDFELEIRSQLASARLMIAIIGRSWLTVPDEYGQRRIDNKRDFVRIELKWGLENKVRMIPVLVDEATMPLEKSLPPPLRAFSRCQSLMMRPDPDFRTDINKLIAVCRMHLDSQPS